MTLLSARALRTTGAPRREIVMSEEQPHKVDLEQLRRQGHELVRSFRAKRQEAIDRIRANFPKLQGQPTEKIRDASFGLRDALLVVAREQGFPSWPKLQERADASKHRIHDLLGISVPVLPVSDVEETLRFYEEVLGFPSGWRVEGFGGTTGMLFQEKPDLARRARGLQAMVEVDDSDTVYEIHKQKGAKITQEIQNTYYGSREYRVEDNNGHILRFWSSTE